MAEERTELTAEALEAQGDVAADYLEGLLDICDFDGDFDIEVKNGRAYVSVASSGSDLERLAQSDAVAALQELARLSVQAKTGEFSRLILDVGGSRGAREAELERIVEAAIARIEEGSVSAALPPMSSYERKLVHDIVAERGYVSTSRGEGHDRHTIVTAR